MSPRTDASLRGTFETIDELFIATAELFADREAYVEPGARLSFAQWHERSDALAVKLQERGIVRGDVVALLLPSSIDYAICYAAILKLRAVTTGINPLLGSREIASIVAQCEPKLMIVDDAMDLKGAAPAVPVLDRSKLVSAYAHADFAPVRDRCNPSDVVTIMWTSGTTGQAKGVCLDHLNQHAVALAAGPMSAPGDRKLMATPLVHAGYMARLWDQLASGSTVVISPTKLTAQAMLSQILAERITVVSAVPTQWERLVELPHIQTADLSHVRICTSATAPARPELVEKVKDVMGCPVIVRYAMTESPTISGTDPDDPPEVQFRTVGRPQHGMEVSVEAAPGQVGMVRVRGGCVMRGYWNAPDLTAAAFDKDGWLITNDLGYIDESGNLTLCGRAGDMYIRGGYNIYPTEVEAVLALHPDIAAASVVGVRAPTIGEIGVAFVVPIDASRPPSLADIREFVRRELAEYKAPDALEVLAELPVNAMQKVNKQVLRERAARLARRD